MDSIVGISSDMHLFGIGVMIPTANNEKTRHMKMPSLETCYHCELYPLFSNLAVCIVTSLVNDCYQVSTSSVLLM